MTIRVTINSFESRLSLQIFSLNHGLYFRWRSKNIDGKRFLFEFKNNVKLEPYSKVLD